MKEYSSFTVQYVQDICDALNEIGDLASLADLSRKPFKPEYFETLTNFLQYHILYSLGRYTYLDEKRLINRGRCPYTGQKIDSSYPSWTFMGNRVVYLSQEGYEIMRKEDDESYMKIHGHPRPPKPQNNQKGCYVATVCYGSEFAPEVLVLKEYRDNVLSLNLSGRLFIKFYYLVSPWLANRLQKRKNLNEFIRVKIIDKIVRRINLRRIY